jgi:UDP-N-acetylmuramate--alanine ligase
MARIVIAAGGTAGHVVPALAIADELRANGADISFIGTRERAEAELVPAAGYDISHLSVSGLDRRNPLRAAVAIMRAARAVVSSLRLLRRARADAVLAAGGYVAGPVGVAAVLARTPLVLSESDSHLGLANRLLARFARRVCLSFPIEGREGERYLVTGRPVPRPIREARRDEARTRLGVAADARCLFVFGGSLGARSINLAAVEAFGEQQSFVVVHVSGRRDFPQLSQRLEQLGRPPHYHLYEYLDTLADPLAASDLVLARSGGSVFEIAAAARPALLVPFPQATAGHQRDNARWMADAGAAVTIDDSRLDSALLSRMVPELLADDEQLASMSSAAAGLARPAAAERIAGELLAAAEESETTQRDSRDWNERRLHFVGIGGAGMSGLALIARRLGARVSGCDRAESAYTAMLRRSGIEPSIGHSPEHVQPGMEVVVSTAVPDDSPELLAARRLRVPILHRGELLSEAASLRRLIAVSGTHGKTTTAAMAAHALIACGVDPSYLVGAELRAGDDGDAANSAWGDGGWMVAEADESDRSFLRLGPEIAVVTNLELDHHTTYGSLMELEQAFRDFLARVPKGGSAVFWDRPELRALVPEGTRAVTYDVLDDSDAGSNAPYLGARSLHPAGGGVDFELWRSGERICDVQLPAPGRHNVLNALAALAACELAGCDLEQAARSLAGFRAAGRRFELRGEGRGVRVFDDYAHHPTEVLATLDAARSLQPRRLIAVFQPHLYSRTRHLHRELGRALARADVVVVLDVYAARERPEGELAGVTGKLVAEASADQAHGREVWWLPTLDEAHAVLSHRLSEGDLIVTLGAGDVDRLAERLVADLDGGAQT